MIELTAKGNFDKTTTFLEKLKNLFNASILDRYGKKGVDALSRATPVDTGKTASSWSYEVRFDNSGPSIIWSNGNVNRGVNVALILDQGHGTGTGGYVRGLNYIDPALDPVIEELKEELRKEVTNNG